jgi:methylmalonyl-CoA/ethylmalonyl-CoA epimerase
VTPGTESAAVGVDTGASKALRSVGAVFDHVAHAVPSIRAVLPLYLDLLGGWLSGGGFNPWGGHVAVQIAYPGGGLIELLEPTQADSPSVGRFLERNPRGGLHHLTFKVKDLEAAVVALKEAGFEPFGTMLDRPRWKETYLHPRQTGGVLIQLAQSAGRVGPLDRPVEELLDRAEEMRAGRG